MEKRKTTLVSETLDAHASSKGLGTGYGDIMPAGEVQAEKITDNVVQSVRNEILRPEYARDYMQFYNMNTGDVVRGKPMADLGDAFVFEIDGLLKKINARDIKPVID